MKTLSPGRWRGLKTTSTENRVFTILAFDQRGSYRRMMPATITTYAEAVALKQEIVVKLAPYTSAVLLDSTYGLGPAMHMSGRAGLLVALEKTGYSGDATYRSLVFEDTWTVEKIKRMGASAVKMMVYYHPDTGELADGLDEVVRQTVVECHKYDLPMFLEPMSYSIDAAVDKSSEAFAATRAHVVKETARRLSATGADILKLEFPLDVAFNSDEAEWQRECEAVSAVCESPWVLLSAGVDAPIFEKQVKIACEAGASGFLAGRAVWKEAVNMTAEERAPFLANVAPERLHRLTEITSQYAKPWTDFYAAPASDEGWYDTYPGIE